MLADKARRYPMLDLRRLGHALPLLTGLLPAILAGGCCGGLPPSNSVVAQVDPAQATVPAGGAVALVGNATGLANFMDRERHSWWVQENLTSPTCQETVHITTGCTRGYVDYSSDRGLPASATYHAPATPGTYHVSFNVYVGGKCYGEFDAKTATATITVTP
jgi:hypothetical protein